MSGRRPEGGGAGRGSRAAKAAGQRSGAPSAGRRETRAAGAQLIPRLVAERVLARVEADDAWADRVFLAEARRASLQGRDRALAARLAYGTIERRRTLDHVIEAVGQRRVEDLDAPLRHAIRLGAYQLLFSDRIPAHAAVSTSVDLARRVAGARVAGLANAILRRVATEGPALVAALTDETPADCALAASLPDWIVELWWDGYGPETARALARTVNDPPELTVATLDGLAPGARERTLAVLEREGVAWHGDPAAPAAIVLDDPFDVAASEAFVRGDAIPMSRSSQRVVGLLDARPGERVLDACAAPGGKAALLASTLGGATGLVCVERDAHRANALRETLRRVHASAAEIVTDDATDLSGDLTGFDAILLDAPCSGLGTLSSRPDLRWRRSPADVLALAEIQERLLDALAGRLAPHGRIVYAVCTLTPAETTGVTRRRPPVALLECWPHHGDGDGFWAARIEP